MGFCKDGFFSAVQHRDEPDSVMIRARFSGDLERLCERIGVDRSCISVTPDADYAYRITVPKTVWANAVKDIADDIDYDNFKNSVHEGGMSPRDKAYMDCWYAMVCGQMKQ